MTKKEITEKIRDIKKLIQEDEEFSASLEFEELIGQLHNEKKYTPVIESFNKISKLSSSSELYYSFELAFAFVELDNDSMAAKVYEYLLILNPENTAILNNLSNIKKRKRKFKEAFDLISRAYEIEPNDEIISNNYNTLNQKISEIKEKEQKFRHSLIYLERENKFVIDKLTLFIQNTRKDQQFSNGIIAIPKWKFKVFMQTDEDKSESLRNQWIDKNYICETGQRGEYSEIIYEINPFLEKAISEIKLKVVNDNWIQGIEKLNTKNLEEINFYRNLKKINKINKQFKKLILRDYEELTLNYLMKNHKSTIILSGSLIETLLIYHLKKKKITNVSYQVNNRNVSKGLFEATLNDLLQFLEQKKMLEKHFVHLGNISRIFRNYVHPGKELRETEELDQSKSNICYISASELINTMI